MAGRKSSVFAAVAVIIAVAAGVLLWHAYRQPSPVGPVATPGKLTGPATVTTPGEKATPPAETAQPLPPLIHGNPLTDEKFANISAKIVVGATQMKQDKDWQINTLTYMAKVLKDEGVDEKDFTDYAKALHRSPDRGRAVAANIITKTDKALGYHVSMDKLPMFKFTPDSVKKLDKQLQEKLK